MEKYYVVYEVNGCLRKEILTREQISIKKAIYSSFKLIRKIVYIS